MGRPVRRRRSSPVPAVLSRRVVIVAAVALTAALAGAAVLLLVRPAEPAPDLRPTTVRTAETLLREGQGVPGALALLRQRTGSDPALPANGRAIARAIGALTAGVPGAEPAAVLQQCDDTYLSGCFLGVLETVRKTSGSVPAAFLTSACGERQDALRARCVVGLGDALLDIEGELQVALARCEEMRSGDVDLCAQGVFGANLGRLAQHQYEDLSRPPHLHTEGVPGVLLRADDPHVPCRDVSPRHRPTCYELQPWGILQMHKGDVQVAVNTCAQLSGLEASRCTFGLGRDLLGPLRIEDAMVTSGCALVATEQRGWCYGGALLSVSDSLERMHAVCAATTSDTACGGALARVLAYVLRGDPARLQKECLRLPENSRAACASPVAVPPRP